MGGFDGWEFARKEQMSKLDGKSFQRLVSAWRCSLGQRHSCVECTVLRRPKTCHLRLQLLWTSQGGFAVSIPEIHLAYSCNGRLRVSSQNEDCLTSRIVGASVRCIAHRMAWCFTTEFPCARNSGMLSSTQSLWLCKRHCRCTFL